VTFGVKVTRDDGPDGHVHFDVFAGRNEHARGRSGSWCLRHDEFEAFMARLRPEAIQHACLCDPSDVFEPPDPTPRVVASCPSHQARRAYQRYVDEQRAPARRKARE
jgi:hypothetical protein